VIPLTDRDTNPPTLGSRYVTDYKVYALLRPYSQVPQLIFLRWTNPESIDLQASFC
jgi:hypothetical protein